MTYSVDNVWAFLAVGLLLREEATGWVVAPEALWLR